MNSYTATWIFTFEAESPEQAGRLLAEWLSFTKWRVKLPEFGVEK